MQAIVLHGTGDIRFESDFPDPTPTAGEVLLNMTYSSICQTDIEVWQHDPFGMFKRGSGPRIQGHEAAGIVAELGDGVTSLRIGDRVAVENVRTCGQCFFCRRGQQSLCENGRNFGFSDNGGLAELAVWPANLCIKLPATVTNEEAPLSEPTSVAVHAVMRSGVQVGDSAAVIGCGVVGLATVQVLRAAGAKVIAIDPRASSLKLATELGAEAAIDPVDADVPAEMAVLTGGYGPDVVIETAGASGTSLNAVEWVRRGGRAVIVGFGAEPLPIVLSRAIQGEKTLVGSSAAGVGEYRKAVDLIASGKVNVKPLISEIVRLDRGIDDGFERMLRPEKDVYRILVGNGA